MDATVAKIKKTGKTEIWISLRDFQGKQFIDLREHFLLADDNQWHPTKKGVMVLQEHFPLLIKGVRELEETTVLGTVATLPKSSREEIQIGVREFANTRYGEIRVWYSADGQAEKRPSQKGVTFNLVLAQRLVDAFSSADKYLSAHRNSP